MHLDLAMKQLSRFMFISNEFCGGIGHVLLCSRDDFVEVLSLVKTLWWITTCVFMLGTISFVVFGVYLPP